MKYQQQKQNITSQNYRGLQFSFNERDILPKNKIHKTTEGPSHFTQHKAIG